MRPALALMRRARLTWEAWRAEAAARDCQADIDVLRSYSFEIPHEIRRLVKIRDRNKALAEAVRRELAMSASTPNRMAGDAPRVRIDPSNQERFL